jgi:hypothetical protein
MIAATVAIVSVTMVLSAVFQEVAERSPARRRKPDAEED